MLTLAKVFARVVSDKWLDKYKSEGGEVYCLHNGCKISKKGGMIKIYNLNTGGGTFARLSDRQMLPFRMYGFRAGTEYLNIDNIRTEIMVLAMEIKKMSRNAQSPGLLKAKKRRTLLENQLHEEVFQIKRKGY